MRHPLVPLCAAAALISCSSILAAGTSWPWWSRTGITQNAPEDICAVKMPPGFVPIAPMVGANGELSLNARFRSPDGSVEFAIAVAGEGAMQYQVGAGERVLSVKPTTVKGKGPQGQPYTSVHEEITIQGPKGSYTRYLKNEGSAFLWEFKVASEGARKNYQTTYVQFKKGLSLPGMGD